MSTRSTRTTRTHTHTLSVAVGYFLRENDVPWVSEAQYIGTTLIAVVLLVALCIARPLFLDSNGLGRKEAFYLCVAMFGVGIFGAGPVMDRFLCEYIGNPFGNLLLPAFFGCDIGFLGVYGYSNLIYTKTLPSTLNTSNTKSTNSKKSKKSD